MNQRMLLAIFADAGALVEAARELQRRGDPALDAYTPYRVPELEGLLLKGRPKPGWLAFASSLGGGALALAVQWLTNARWYPLDAGGRPTFAIPAFLPIAFETALLAGALATFAWLLWRTRLPCLAHPLFELPGFEGTSLDEFWLAVPGPRTRLSESLIRKELERLGARRVLTAGEPSGGGAA